MITSGKSQSPVPEINSQQIAVQPSSATELSVLAAIELERVVPPDEIAVFPAGIAVVLGERLSVHPSPPMRHLTPESP